MNRFRSISARFFRDTEGLSTVEYVIILALIAALSVGAWNAFGKNVQKYVGDATEEIDTNMP